MNKAKLLKRLDTIYNNCGDCFYCNRNSQYDCYSKIGKLIKDIEDGKFDGARRGTSRLTNPFKEEQ